MQETQVPFLSWKDPLEEGMATHSSILAWRIPIDRGAQRATVHGVAKSWTCRSNLVHAYQLGNKWNKHSSIAAAIIKDVKCQSYFLKEAL